MRVWLGLGVCSAFISSMLQADEPSQIVTSGATTAPATQVMVTEDVSHAPFRDQKLPLDQRVDDLFARLTPMEKAALLHGASSDTTLAIPRLGLLPIRMTDGPQGVRGPKATKFPSGIALAATWDIPLVEQMGSALGEETLGAGFNVILGPGLNIMRTPLGGRNFEYMGEDPVLSGKTAGAYIRGVQSAGASACPKHYTGNEQERWRTTMSIDMSERALREIYAKNFEIAFEEGKPWSMMAGYNKFRGEYCCHSSHLLVDLMRKDWKWDGLATSDWGAWHGTVPAVNGGCEIEMGGWTDTKRDEAVVKNVESGKIKKDMFDSAVKSNLRFLIRLGAVNQLPKGSINTPEHQAVARRVAAESIVLLKNNDHLLPLDAAKINKIAVVGPAANYKFATNILEESGGSGAVFTPYEITPLQGIKNAVGKNAEIVYTAGFSYLPPATTVPSLDIPENGITEATALAAQADVAIVCVGTNHRYDREAIGWGDVAGSDKPDLELIGPSVDLIKAVQKANPKTIVLLINGAPVSVEQWHEQVPAIVEAWYPGIEGGNAIADVLFGNINPSGKLPCTFGKKLTDWKCHTMTPEVFPGTGNNGKETYSDDIWVGYRHFDRDNIEPRFPFGFGLSYTTFTYGQLDITTNADDAKITFTVTNTGQRAGSEVAQLYVSAPKSPVERPLRELKGFAKVHLKPGESQQVTLTVRKKDLAYWDEQASGWSVVPGNYILLVGSHSRNLPLSVIWAVK